MTAIINVHNFMCNKNNKMGKAALASMMKNLAGLAESRQCALGLGFSAIKSPAKNLRCANVPYDVLNIIFLYPN